MLLGHTLQGSGFAEVEQAVALIVRQPACAHFISRELATYFVADDPPPRLVAAMAQTFERTDGDIAAVLRTMFDRTEFEAALGTKFKDPVRYVVSAVRFAYDGQTIHNTRPLLNWLNALGEAPFGRQTPDGYALTEAGWASSGQMSRRFEIARAIGSGNAARVRPRRRRRCCDAAAFRNCRTGCTSKPSSPSSPTQHPHRARSRDLAAGMEYVPAGLTGVQL